MKEVLLVKTGELALKGLNRGTFEEVLIKNIKRALLGLGSVEIIKAQSTIYIEPPAENFDFSQAENLISKVFGIAAFSRAAAVSKDINTILETACVYLAPILKTAKTFKVESKRADKTFGLTSPEISARSGEAILAEFPHLRVDVNEPERRVTIEIRERLAYIYEGKIPGAGGLPVGTGGYAAVLISGGIDSPVAAWMMAKRGIKLMAVHFASPPYTGERAEMKVRALLTRVGEYAGQIKLFIVPFTEIQEQIAKNCPEDLATVLGRRFMMKAAARLARREGAAALITGESAGQVASQTLQALVCTDDAAGLPVLRPLIGMDKEEIIRIARKIDTFDISVLPYEDCCSVFTPKHPRTRPKLEKVLEAEKKIDGEALLVKALAFTKIEN
ncbi:MAG: tRNA 4-thiouridine(8) synthase ThiI [Oscillospiraceae bacterium]|jgi:thiamine biosynthesis protein ThiI|nr:tRNA 4-thiouridine(8) synthase ThiI [Oscillospiraceae bacterium]